MTFSTDPPLDPTTPAACHPTLVRTSFVLLGDVPEALEAWSLSILDRLRRRSVAFLEREGESWACFLVTFLDQDRRWHGYFSFRPKDGELEEDEVRTADIFREASEAEIDHKARGLGRPLLSGLLASALHTRERSEG